jgi:hypothetical protein
MGILSISDAVQEWGDFHQPWKVGSWKDKIESAEFGSPFHGLTAGYTMHNLFSPSVHNWDRLQDYRDNGSDGLLSRSREQMHQYGKDAWDENWPVAAAYLGGVAAGAGGGGAAGGASGGSAAGQGAGYAMSAGDAAALDAAGASASMSGTTGVSSTSGMGMNAPAAGMDWGNLLGQSMGLLGQAGGLGGQQQQPAAVSSPPPQQRDQGLQQRVAMQKRIQALRQKPRKTLAEQQELQELLRNQTGQM